MHLHYCGCDIRIHSVVDVSDKSEIPVEMKMSGSLPEEKPEKGKNTSDGIDFLGARITRDDDGTV